MDAYRKLSKKEYLEIRHDFRQVNASFWHAADENTWPQRRIYNSYRRAVVTRLGDTLYFFAANQCWIIPEDEYRFIEGDVNTDTTELDYEGRRRYYEASQWCLKHDCEPWELDGFEKCPGSVLKVGLDAPKPKFNAKVAEKAPRTTTKAKKQAEIRPLADSCEPKCAPVTPKVDQVPKHVQNEPKKAAQKPKRAPGRPRKAIGTTKETVDSLNGVVNPIQEDRSGWKGTRKRRSCVSKRNTHESVAGCMAIGAMFARKVDGRED